MNQNYKIIAFIVALKRQRRNSVIFKGAFYKMAHQINLSPQTFKKYLASAIQLGYIEEFESGYKIIKFKKILKNFYQETDLGFGQHNILSSGEQNFKKILQEVEEHFLIDNTIKRQEYEITRKKTLLESYRVIQTGKGRTTARKLKRLFEAFKVKSWQELQSVATTMKKILQLNEHAITSARNVAKKLKISTSKANKILNSLKTANREIICHFVDGICFEKIEYLREMFPGATVYPLLSLNKIKISFGSKIHSKVYIRP